MEEVRNVALCTWVAIFVGGAEGSSSIVLFFQVVVTIAVVRSDGG